MLSRVQVLGFVDDISNNLEVKHEGDLIKTMTHIHGVDGYIKSYEMALIQLDNGTFETVNIKLIRLKK
ncbi:MAG: hypothetical protein KIC67_09410 [Clostridium butyricum]|nr:hypothetical protein [Clostridium butyricum]